LKVDWQALSVATETVAKSMVRRYLNGIEAVCVRKLASPRSKQTGSRIMAARDVLTKNQLCVLEKLEAASGPLSAYMLLDQLRERGFRAPLQIYRALDTLVKTGFVHRLESINSFVACAEPHDHGHSMTAFAICDTCGQVAEMSDHDVDHRLDEWVRSTGFAAKKAVIEFRGICAKCRAEVA